MAYSAFGIDHGGTVSKGYPLGSTAAKAEEVLRSQHSNGEHARNLVQNCRQCQHAGRKDLLRAKLGYQK